MQFPLLGVIQIRDLAEMHCDFFSNVFFTQNKLGNKFVYQPKLRNKSMNLGRLTCPTGCQANKPTGDVTADYELKIVHEDFPCSMCLAFSLLFNPATVLRHWESRKERVVNV